MKIIQRRERKTKTTYMRVFNAEPGRGWSFDCNEHGVLLPSATPDAVKNFRDCVLGTMQPAVEDMGIRQYTHSWVEPAMGICACGGEVVLDHFTCTCTRCGRDYNMSGQELAGRENWGEETGESVADILLADTDPFGGDY